MRNNQTTYQRLTSATFLYLHVDDGYHLRVNRSFISVPSIIFPSTGSDPPPCLLTLIVNLLFFFFLVIYKSLTWSRADTAPSEQLHHWDPQLLAHSEVNIWLWNQGSCDKNTSLYLFTNTKSIIRCPSSVGVGCSLTYRATIITVRPLIRASYQVNKVSLSRD